MTPPAAAAPAVHRGRTTAPGRPLAPTPRPRRISGPSRSRTAAPAARTSGGLAIGALAALRSLSRHRLLGRLIAGRIWIAFVAFALIGIVTLQLGLLKLNSSIGRSLERQALLQRENATLSIENSELAEGDHVEAAAMRLGMELVPAGALRFLHTRPHGDTGRAAGVLSRPIATNPPALGEASGGSSSGASSTPAAGPEAAASTSAGVPVSSESHAAAAGEANGAAGEAPAATSTQSSPAGAATPSLSAGAAAGSTGGGAGEAASAGGTGAGPAG